MGVRMDSRKIWGTDPQDLMWKVKRDVSMALQYESADEQRVCSA